MVLGSISAALSCLVCVPPRAGSFPEQRLVIEPMVAHFFLLLLDLVHAANYDAVQLVTTFEMVKLEGCYVSTGNIISQLQFPLFLTETIVLRIKLISI